MLRRLGLIILLVGISAGCLGCVFRRPKVSVKAVRFGKIYMTEDLTVGAEIVFNLEVANPNPYSITLKNLRYDLSVEGGEVVSGKIVQPNAKLSARAVQPLDMTATVTMRGLSKFVTQHITADTQGKDRLGYEANVNCWAGVWGLGMNVSRRWSGRIPAINPLEITLRRARVKRVGLSPAVEVELDITNPNEFELKLTRLSGSLLFDKTELISVETVKARAIGAGQTVRTVLLAKLDVLAVRRVAPHLAKGLSRLRFKARAEMAPPELQMDLKEASSADDH